ncbi:MAG: 16S rRNA (guanine(527)-N(7))-methyltransferase RsmG [Ruminococcaceae bacterium]|nr:16S rRNA (guanine(527)-N(7))-methyltransferase RsmG [Oscillospiraceae bacterium]
MDKTLRAGLPALNLTLSEAQQKTLCAYGEAMLEKNKVMNLTAIVEPERVAQLHFLDSLALLNLADFSGKKVIDVGCGAGLPGVPLKIGEESISLTLLDSLGKRMDWLREILPQLGVEAEVVTARAEEAVAQRRESYDIAVSRAVARLNMLCELCLPYVKVGGVFLAMKGALAEEETAEAARAIRTLGGELERIAEYPVSDSVHRVAIIRKVKNTPAAYPRRFAKIKQQPL